jgi:hypothetical protein
MSPLDLGVGAQFHGPIAGALHAALLEAVETITRMPANFLTYPNGGAILPVVRGRAGRRPETFVLDAAYLASFGAIQVLRDLWRALQRFAPWVEPALITEWQRLMRAYAESQGRMLDDGQIGLAMTWADPARDVSLPRDIALHALDQGQPVLCVWTGELLQPTTLDIDHCMPWAAWPCSDLWNLLPVNRHQKRDRLSAATALQRARDGMLAWWQSACLSVGDTALQLRFSDEVRAKLPALAPLSDVPTPPKSMLPSRFSDCDCTRISRCQSGAARAVSIDNLALAAHRHFTAPSNLTQDAGERRSDRTPTDRRQHSLRAPAS